MFTKFFRVFYRPPDFNIGPTDDIYLRRWWVIPRNRFFNIYLHNALRSDDDRALHDHPWWNLSIVLRGGYWEVMPNSVPTNPDWYAQHCGNLRPVIDDGLARVGAAYFQSHVQHRIWRRPGSFILRRSTDAHRLELGSRDVVYGTRFSSEHSQPIALFETVEQPSWSLFITGPKLRTWGFWCPRGWVQWERFVKIVPGGNEVGEGCGE